MKIKKKIKPPPLYATCTVKYYLDILYTQKYSVYHFHYKTFTVRLKGERHEKQIHKNAFVFVGQRVYFYSVGVILNIYIYIAIAKTFIILYFPPKLVRDFDHALLANSSRLAVEKII